MFSAFRDKQPSVAEKSPRFWCPESVKPVPFWVADGEKILRYGERVQEAGVNH